MDGYISDDNDWNEWDSDQEGDYFNVPVKDLFSSQVFDSPGAFTKYAVENYSFDICALFKDLKLDTYGRVRLINFLRKNVGSTSNPAALYNLATTTADQWRKDDDLLLPVDAEDGLLQYAATLRQGFGGDSDLEWSDDEDADFQPISNVLTNEDIQRRENAALKTRVEELEEIVARMTKSVQVMTLEGAVAPIADADTEASEEETKMPEEKLVVEEVPKKKLVVVDDIKSNDAAYFGGYSMREIHETMLRDRHRTESYRDAMLARSEDLFKGKTVLDVGCGTGILSMFAACAGAKRVIGVDAANIIDKTREIVRVNKLDHVISLVKGKVEEISLPEDVLTVDIIVSEWMGYFLLYESMLPSVFFARDKWMRRSNGISVFEACTKAGKPFTLEEVPTKEALPFAPDALLFPDVARMFVSAVETRQMRKETQAFWKDVYGFDMTCLITPDDAFPTASVDHLYAADSCSISDKKGLVAFDLMHDDAKDLIFKSNVTLNIEKEDVIDAFVVWFDTIFSSKQRRDNIAANPKLAYEDFAPVPADDSSVVLDTSYFTVPTHWRQTLFRLSNVLKVQKGDVVTLELVATTRKDNHRHYDISISYELQSASSIAPEGPSPVMNTNWGKPGVKYTQDYSLQ